SSSPLYVRSPPAASAPIFAYTTLFRSSRTACGRERNPVAAWRGGDQSTALCSALSGTTGKSKCLSGTGLCLDPPRTGEKRSEPDIALERISGQLLQCRACPIRSEEHTSELQSRFDLVCRPLLEKKTTIRYE